MKRDVVTVREPGGTEIGEQIRNIIVHNSKGDEMCPETELLLFAAARAQLVREVIAPALMRGAIVLSDRFLDSSTVYQGIGRNLAADPVNQINRFAVGNVMPDLTIVIDVPTKVGLARIHQRASDLPDRMERENIGCGRARSAAFCCCRCSHCCCRAGRLCRRLRHRARLRSPGRRISRQ